MITEELERAPVAISAEEIEQQLARMVDSHHFCHSHRYPALLKYLVEQAQQGKGSQLKERLLGIEVFHRAPDYDTNSDPVVRVTAAEVRKRIAQYYQEPEHSDEVRIDLPTGSYVPRFFRSPPATSKPAPLPHTAEVSPAPAPAPVLEDARDSAISGATPHVRRTPRWLMPAICFCVGALFVVGAVRSVDAVTSWRERALRDFWAPLAANDAPILVTIGDHTVGEQGNALRAGQGAAISPSEDVLKLMNEHEQVTISDVTSLFKITNYMVRHNRSFHTAGAGSASIADLRVGPVLLFAGLDNRWTMRLTQHLRYRFVDSPIDTMGAIEDSQHPGRVWQVDFTVPYNKMPIDYAVVARYYDPLIEEPVMIAAGIGETGTVSASEFVTSDRLIREMNALAPKGWKQGNVEVVLATPVVDGRPGPPHIVASQFW